MKLLDYLQKQSQTFVVVLGGILFVLFGVADHITGSELSFSIFYLIPIAMIAWFIHSLRIAVAASAVGALIWLAVDLASGKSYSSTAIPFWNAGVRLGFFLIVTYTLSSLHAARIRQDELAQFIVHDLRSPLSNALAGLQYLLDFSEDKLDDGLTEIVKLSIASCNRMMTLVNSLLDLGKLESGQFDLNAQPTDVKDLFDTALQQVSAMALRGRINIISEIEPDTQLVLADSELSVRVLVNLVSNALKYSPKDATVLVRAAPHTDHMAAISIADKGVGIPKEWTERIFDKYAQVEAHQKGIAAGTGLGLTFCRLAIEAQGGRIWLSSEKGLGTTVTFTLPQIHYPSVTSGPQPDR